MKYKMLGFLAGALFSATTFAQGMKPGLWEMSTQMPENPAAQQQMAKMSPAERKQMEKLMAQQGIQMVGNLLIDKVCITPEMANKDIAQEMAKSTASSQKANCTTSSSPRVGNTLTSSFTCDSKPPFTGKVEMTFQSDTAYSMKMHVVRGEQTLDSQGSGQWLSADCGKVKPALLPSGK